jgi:hypothetical protein
MVPGWGLSSGPVDVVIEGENFLGLAGWHLGEREPVAVDARFEAFLDEVALEEVFVEDVHTLRARVPAGIVPGWHTLVVVGPQGQRVELPRAWFASERPLARLEAQAALERTQVEVGERVRVRVTLENVGSTAALGVAPVLRMAGEGQVERLAEPGPVELVPGARASFAWELVAVAAGAARFSVEAVGHEQEMGEELRMPGLDVGPLWIRPPPGSLVARFSPLPTSIAVGQTFDVEFEVTNPGGHPVLGVKPDAYGYSGMGWVTLVSGPEPASADLPAGGRVVFRGRLQAMRVGPCTLRAGASGLEQSRGVTVVAPPVDSSLVTVR